MIENTARMEDAERVQVPSPAPAREKPGVVDTPGFFFVISVLFGFYTGKIFPKTVVNFLLWQLTSDEMQTQNVNLFAKKS